MSAVNQTVLQGTLQRVMSRPTLLRVLVVATVVLGVNYIAWRWLVSLNWNAWWIAVPLVVAETFSLIDVSLFGLTVWRARVRPAAPVPDEGITVDVFITTLNEPIDLVLNTALTAVAIRYPHKTWILDDGARADLRVEAESLGIGYITRSDDWENRPLHAKAGNLNNALMQTESEFLLILDADQVPQPEFLDRTLGFFQDSAVAVVQTPQVFGNVPGSDPLGNQAPLFYGPIQQGKDGWNAAYFCGSNALLRREALMQLGIARYVEELDRAVVKALAGAARVLAKARRTTSAGRPEVQAALAGVASAIADTRVAVAKGAAIGSATYDLQQRIDAVSRDLVSIDLHVLALDLEAIRDMHVETDATWDVLIDVDRTVDVLASRDLSPLGALESVQTLLRSIDVHRSDEAQPLMPLATISVTEDMATSMRLHGLGWKSVYHQETLAIGLAPEDLGSMLKQRLRWAQGTMQVMLLENPLWQRGLTLAQRLMYLSTMWGYLGGFAALVYFAAPVVFLCFGVLPVDTNALEFFERFLPFMVVNQLMFAVAGWGIPTWRGQQFSLALFPVWIWATVSAIANVWFHRPLGFVVTPKTRQNVGRQWRLIMPQITVSAILVIAAVIGVGRFVLGAGEPIGTMVNVAWVAFDLVILGVMIPAARHKGSQTEGASSNADQRYGAG